MLRAWSEGEVENVLDYETQSAYIVVVEAMDSSGLASRVEFELRVDDVMENPSILNATLSVGEQDNGGMQGIVVGILEAVDPDNHTSFSWAISQNFRVDGSDVFAMTTEASSDPAMPGLTRGVLVLLPGARIDYENMRTLQVEIEVRDSSNPLTWLTSKR